MQLLGTGQDCCLASGGEGPAWVEVHGPRARPQGCRQGFAAFTAPLQPAVLPIK